MAKRLRFDCTMRSKQVFLFCYPQTQQPNYFDAWDAKGLAYSGLTLCESSEHIPKAIEAYRAARVLCKDVGIVNRVLRLFEALAVADEKGILAEVRKAAAGEE